MKILRLYCLGNEYYVVSAHHPLPLVKGLGQSIPRREVVVLSPEGQGQCRVEQYNSLGTRVVPGTCALRCAAYVLGSGSWHLDTDTGSHLVDVRDGETVFSFFSPIYGGEYQIGWDYHGYLVNLVQRYFITLPSNINGLDIQGQGEALDRYFGGADIIFVQEGRDIDLRIWQRGGELAGSCTGACAVAAVLYRLGRWREPMQISMPGGKVTMEYYPQGRFLQRAEVQEVGVLDYP